MKVILEYNEEKGTFRHNYIIEGGDSFFTPLFLYGWKPVCIIDNQDETLKAVCIALEKHNYSFEKITARIFEYLLNTQADDE